MLSFFLLLMAWQSPGAPVPCRAYLELHRQGGLLTVVGHCHNLLPTAGAYRYEMSTLRKGSGGHSENTQRGQFEVAPQQDVALSSSTINTTAQDTYCIHLRIVDLTGRTVAQDSASQVAAR